MKYDSLTREQLIEELKRKDKELTSSQRSSFVPNYNSNPETMHEQFFNNSPIGIVYYDKDGVVTAANQALADIMEASTDKLIGLNIHQIPNKEFVQNVLKSLKGEASHYEGEYVSYVSGKKVYLKADWIPIKINNEVVSGIGLLEEINEWFITKTDLEKHLKILTLPIDDIEELHLNDLFEIKELESLQDLICKAMNVASSIVDSNGETVTPAINTCRLCKEVLQNTPKGEKNCKVSDGLINRFKPDGPIIEKCCAGLLQAGASIVVGGKHIGNWLIGHVKPPDLTEEKLEKYVLSIDGNVEKAKLLAKEVPEMEEKEFRKKADAIFAIAGQLSNIAYQNLQQARFINEKESTEKKLIENEAQLRTLIETIPDYIWLKDVDGVYLACNKKFEKFFGASLPDIMGKTDYDFVDKELADFFRLNDKKAMAADGPVMNEETVTHADDGQFYDLETIKTPLKIGEKVIGVLGVACDITRRKKAEEKLADQKQRLNDILIGTASGTWEWNVQTGEAVFNERWAEIIGYTLEELEPISIDTWNRFAHPDDITISAEKLEKHFAGELEYYSAECRMKHKDGHWVWVLDRGKVSKWTKDGRPLWMYGTHQDITERKRNEELLIEREIKLRESQKVAKVGYYNFNVFENNWSSSEELDAIFGISPAFEKTAENWQALIHPDYAENMMKYLVEEVLTKHNRFDKIYKIVTRDTKEEKWVHGKGELKFNSDGNPILMFGTIQDITERKKTEEALQKSVKLESLGTLAGGIAHDFNNFLTGIYGNIDLAIAYSQDEKVRSFLEKTGDSIDRAKNLTNQLLTFAKGGTPVKAIESIKKFIVEASEFALSGSNVSVDYNIQEDLWMCEIDKHQIGQVFDNIVINAQQAMPSGGNLIVTAENITLDIDQIFGLNEGDYLKISIRDNGIGIHKDHLDKIFDPFFTTKTKGHGIGLSTCYSIIHRHNGLIEVNSELGKFTEFTIYIPATKECLNEAMKIEEKEHTGDGCFLIMDDEESLRESVGEMLELFGYEVIKKSSGVGVLQLLNNEEFDTEKIKGMIFDLTIPGGMGGKETMEKLQEINITIPVIVSSGYADDPVISDPKKYGFAGSLVKPFKMQELSRILNDCVGKKNKNPE